MIRLLLLKLPLRLVVWSFFGFIAWQVGVFFLPRPTPYSEDQRRAVERTCRNLTDVLVPQLDRPLRVGVIHLVNDGNDQATAILKATLAARCANWRVIQESVVHRFLSDLGKTVSAATSVDELVNAGRRVQIDLVVAGRVEDVIISNGMCRVSLDAFVCDVQAGKIVYKGRIEGSWSPGASARLARWMRHGSPLKRFLIWLCFVLVMPWATPFGARWAVERKSNAASFALMTTYTVLGVLLAVTLSGFVVSGGAAWMKLFLAFVVSAVYSFWACERIAAGR